MGVELSKPSNRDELPEYYRRKAEFINATGNLWFALSGHPLFGRLGLIRRHFERRAIEAFGRATKLEQEAAALVALKREGKA